MKKSLILLFGILSLSYSCKEKKSQKAGVKMQDFIIAISKYARAQDPNFILIPQNGEEVLFQNTDPENAVNSDFIAAIDGFGVEELFYNNGSYAPDEYRLNMLRKVSPGLKVLVADYLSDDSNYPDAFQAANAEQFIAFPRFNANYDYKYIPSVVYHENTNNIQTLAQAQNYLYLISTDNYSDKAGFLSAIQQTNFDVVIIDAFFGDELLTSTDVASLKTKQNGAQRLVISYMNIGSAEKYRYYWKKTWGLHHPLWLKKKYDGYKDEIWVKFWKDEWQEIIYGNSDSYTQKLLNAGFDGAYLDNIEAFYFLYHKD
ncbi:endo alpha-1,4 polygalactosaminidase [Fluviicola sp.]|uniref:endo alpha-1,4 polygalactosaminidase n=1 Tax=Fluviicola sp. TaxID=1917219 RepID=UPI00260DDB72|nr:endo alpha-1,4 polygalactosaminidase [Fluviicola sp.]